MGSFCLGLLHHAGRKDNIKTNTKKCPQTKQCIREKAKDLDSQTMNAGVRCLQGFEKINARAQQIQ